MVFLLKKVVLFCEKMVFFAGAYILYILTKKNGGENIARKGKKL